LEHPTGLLQGRLNCHGPPKHLDYYLDAYTFRFNRRKSRSRGKLFHRLVQQAVQIDPSPYNRIVGGSDWQAANHNQWG